LSEEGVAVFPADGACAPIWRRLAGTRRVVDFALDTDAVVTATVDVGAEGQRLSIVTPNGVIEARLAVGGLHNARNALAATASAIAIGIEGRAIAAGLAAFRPVSGRGVRHTTAEGALLIDDSYNANPDSVRAAIDLLASLPSPRVLVLGDMGEVGQEGPAFHREVGAYARERGVDAVLALGEQTRLTISAFGAGGMHFDAIDALVAEIRRRLRPGTTVVVKGSRFMRMERVVQALTSVQAEGVH